MPEAGPINDPLELHRCCWGDGAVTASISHDVFLGNYLLARMQRSCICLLLCETSSSAMSGRASLPPCFPRDVCSGAVCRCSLGEGLAPSKSSSCMLSIGG